MADEDLLGVNHSKKSLSVEPLSLARRLQVVHVRLTDFSLQALEQLAQCDDSEIKIQANPNGQGILKMKNPSKKFSKDFKFSYQNSYDESQLLQLVCMKPAQNKADDLGQLCKRITIGATEEVFESTLEKMSAFEADQKKNTVKELNNESKFSPSWKNKKNNTVLPQKMSLVSKMKDIRNKSTSKQTNFETTSTPIPRKFQAFPIQDRIIHTLALRPYKKAHLIARLTNEGITNEEKHKIESILSKVSYFKDGSQPDQCQLSLKDTFKKYVKPDWAGYSYAEQQMMLRNQNFKNSIDDKTSVENKQILINGSENKQIKIQKPVSKQQHVSNSSNPQKSERKEQIISPIKKQLISKAPTIKNEKRHVPAVSSEKPASHDPNKKISLQEYKSFIKEYESTYPKYEELFNKVNKVKEKFTGFKKNALYLKNLSENNQMKEEDISQLEKLKLNVTKESSKVDIKFYDEVNQLKQMHLRLLKVKEYIKGYVNQNSGA